MDQWNFFGFLYNTFVVQFVGAVQTNAATLAAALAAPITVGVTIYLAGTAAMELLTPGTDPFMLFIRKCIRAAFVLGLIGAANYTAIFVTFVLNTLPNEITSAIVGAPTAAGQTAHAFDVLLQGGWVSMLAAIKNLSAWDPRSFVIGLLAIIGYLIGGFFIAIGFVVFIAAQVTLGLAVTVGPIFVALLLWEKTASYFSAWISTLFGAVMTQVVIVALLALLMTTEQNLVKQVVALNAANGAAANDIASQVHYIIEATLLYFLIGYLSPKIEDLARAITGAAAPGIAQLTQATQGVLAKTASKTASVTRVAGSAVASGFKASGNPAAGLRNVTPPGRAP